MDNPPTITDIRSRKQDELLILKRKLEEQTTLLSKAKDDIHNMPIHTPEYDELQSKIVDHIRLKRQLEIDISFAQAELNEPV